MRSVGSKCYAGVPRLEHSSPKSTSSENRQGCSVPETDGWSHLKGQHMNFHVQSLTWDSGKGAGQSGLEMPDERLGMEVLGRELRE